MITESTQDADKPRTMFDMLFAKNPNNVPDDAPIYTSREKTLTFGELSTLIRKCAYNLKEKFAIQKGDVVAIRASRHIDYAVLMHAVVCAGGTIAPISYFQLDTPDTIADDLETAKPKLFITDHKGRDISLKAASKVGIPTSRMLVVGDTDIEGIKSVKDELFSGDKLAEPCTYTPEEYDTLCIFMLFTSGSTGRKKAVIYTPKTMLYSFLNYHPVEKKRERILTHQPFHFGSVAVCELHMPIFFGDQIYIEQVTTAEEICQAVEKYKITALSSAPYILNRMVKEQMTKKYDLSSLTSYFCVGSILHKKIIQEANELFGPIILNAYGSTEAYSSLLATPKLSAMGAIGKLAPEHSVKLVDEDGNEVPPGEPGEFLAKGPTVTPGYYNNPEATAKAFTKDGYYRTGDVLRCDEDGVYWFLSRTKNLIKYRTCHIYPIDIEKVVLKHPKVSDCGVIGVLSQDEFDELPRAYVTLVDKQDYENKEAIARDILDFANKQLPESKQIRAGVIVKESFERTSSGKIIYSALKEEVLNESEIAI